MQEVSGSIPLGSTKLHSKPPTRGGFLAFCARVSIIAPHGD
jgi:hypothetical protein